VVGFIHSLSFSVTSTRQSVCWGCSTSAPGWSGRPEARWQSRPLTRRDLQAIRAKLHYLPEPHHDLELAFWSRGSADADLSAEAGVRLFTCEDMT